MEKLSINSFYKFDDKYWGLQYVNKNEYVFLSEDGDILIKEINDVKDFKIINNIDAKDMKRSSFIFEVHNQTDGLRRPFNNTILHFSHISPNYLVDNAIFERKNDAIEFCEDHDIPLDDIIFDFSISLFTLRHDIPILNFDKNSLIMKWNTPVTSNVFEAGQNVKLVKKTNYTKSKKLTLKQKFVIYAIVNDDIIVKDSNNRFLYLNKRIIKCIE